MARVYNTLPVLALMLCVAVGCQPLGKFAQPDAHHSSQAIKVVTEFYHNLSAGHYQAATAQYRGSYAMLAEWNPDIAADNFAGLLRAACERQLICLPVAHVQVVGQLGSGTLQVTVQFLELDGTLLERKGCCGEDESEAESQTQFDCRVWFEVSSITHDCLPVYIP